MAPMNLGLRAPPATKRDFEAYHLLELQIACNPADSRRVMPKIRPHQRRILDVGCGAGQTLIASGLAADVTAIGIDCNVDALDLGRRLDKRIRFVCARGEALPLPSDHFDLVISRVSLPYMRHRAALAEMARVLAPGGEAWLVLHPAERLKRELAASLKHGDIRKALHRLYVMGNGALASFTGRELPSPASGRYESFQTEDGIRAALEALGLVDLKVERKAFFVVTARKAPPAVTH
jgi:ubiquinone/menaquinone biosynthesis C-methylase UbiE